MTFKTVFLLALGSGKRRSEIHAWQNKNIRISEYHQVDWSKVSLYLSSSFLSKNQLAKEGPDSVAPAVIPALAPTLDKSLGSLCLVRALCYYLNMTSYLRQIKELLVVSFKKGFDKDPDSIPTLAQQLFGRRRPRWPNVGKPPVKKFYSMYSISQSDCSMVLCSHCLTEGK